jgi:hypothetical protein
MRRLVAIMLAAAAMLAVGISPAGATGLGKANPRTFTGTGIISRDYTRQTVTGTLATYKPVPTNVSVFDWQDSLLVMSAKPRLDNNYDGGYWKQTYHLNAWLIGKTPSASYVLLFPDTPVGGTFTVMLMTNFLPNYGNWQNWIDCTTS